ncbi:type II toxin-antitoxin system mRNA interferase toxin, RelE/StbE family [Azoarcus sp. TTM-91]|uniref:type II toxin-antitoxin system RelE/ParE family toxin n=1 Tax=Azoarcus sp. TTM-91 TaxID=2691581 RepID=UPI00145CB634|nr:type II toxin-antitoxin system RelE/ParE family toxin [Azoarcus sp. TTM-91]NMG35202.1 type II toxin-antitoxin system mRNA interferase toxin, RelE/StbE family [Azoarcus sp. TTM-91]
MARLIYTRRALEDLERLTDFLLETEPALALLTVDLIAEALQMLENHPLIGRPAEQDMRELVVSRGRTGYLALYDYDEVRDVVLVLAVRHQREAGYTSS